MNFPTSQQQVQWQFILNLGASLINPIPVLDLDDLKKKTEVEKPIIDSQRFKTIIEDQSFREKLLTIDGLIKRSLEFHGHKFEN